MTVARLMLPALLASLSVAAVVSPVGAEPKCIVETKVILAISPDGRYALGTSDDGLGTSSLDLLDLARGGLPLISADFTPDELAAMVDDPPLEVGALHFRRKDQWKPLAARTFAAVTTGLSARCPNIAARQADGRELDPVGFRR